MSDDKKLELKAWYKKRKRARTRVVDAAMEATESGEVSSMHRACEELQSILGDKPEGADE